MNLGLTLIGRHIGYNSTFGSRTNVPVDTVITSRKVKVLSAGAISITDGIGGYQINNGSWTSDPGTVSINDIVRARLTSSLSYETTSILEITIDGVANVFSVTTIAEVVAEGFPYTFPFILE